MKRNIRIIVMGAFVINALIGCSKQNEVPDSTTK